MKKILLLFVVAGGLMLSSCYQEPENGTAKITVIDENDFRVPNATVTLTGPTGSYINESGVTDFHGDWIYEHDPALEVILNIEAVSEDGLKDGKNIIRIIPDQHAEQTVRINF